MAKIISIENDIVKIIEDNGNLIEVKKSDLGFESKVGDFVDVSRGEGATTEVLSTTLPASISENKQLKKDDETPKFSEAEQKTEVNSATNISQSEPTPEISKNPNVSTIEQKAEINSMPNANKQSAPVSSDKVVSKAVYCVLCFFLGFLGVHKFYAGKIGMGILYIFTLGLFGIGTVIDFIVGIFKKADENGNITI